jgi:hypothetical protein
MRFPALGAIYAVPSGANPTPVPIAISKDVTIGFKVTKKGLRGQWKWFIDVAEFGNEATVKFKNADFRASILSMVFSGVVTTPNASVIPATGEAATIPGTPYQVTVANSAQFLEDGGVLNYTLGKWLIRVASAPATGQYSVAAGVYTFAAADTTHNVSIVYSYSQTVGNTQVLSNTTMGPSTAFAVRIYNQYTINGVVKSFGLKAPAVHFEALNWALKSEDWAEQDIEGIVAQNPAGQDVFTHYVGD